MNTTNNELSAKQIFNSSSLSRREKIQLLKQREYHARQLAVAEDENMAGAQQPNLSEIVGYLTELGAELTEKGTTPTMTGA